MFCTNCGSQLEEGALFCTQCGTRVQNDDFISAAPESFAYIDPSEQAAQPEQAAEQWTQPAPDRWQQTDNTQWAQPAEDQWAQPAPEQTWQQPEVQPEPAVTQPYDHISMMEAAQEEETKQAEPVLVDAPQIKPDTAGPVLSAEQEAIENFEQQTVQNQDILTSEAQAAFQDLGQQTGEQWNQWQQPMDQQWNQYGQQPADQQWNNQQWQQPADQQWNQYGQTDNQWQQPADQQWNNQQWQQPADQQWNNQQWQQSAGNQWNQQAQGGYAAAGFDGNYGQNPPQRVKKEKKKSKAPLFIILGVVLLGLAAAAVWWFFLRNQKSDIALSNYISADFSGVDGYGTINAYLDYDALQKDIWKAMGHEETDMTDAKVQKDLAQVYQFTGQLYSTISQKDGLKNGDKVKVSIDVPQEIPDELCINITDSEKEFTVEGLQEVQMFDPFEGIEVTFHGMSPFVKAEFNRIKQDDLYYYVDFTLDKTSGLAAGDTVTVTASYNEEYLREMGYGVSTDSKTYTVTSEGAYILKAEQLNQTIIDELNARALQFQKEQAAGWISAAKLEDMSYIGHAFIADEDFDPDYNTNSNMLLLVYNVYISTDDGPMIVYEWFGYSNITEDASGTQYTMTETPVQVGDMNVDSRVWTANQRYYIAGFGTIDEMKAYLDNYFAGDGTVYYDITDIPDRGQQPSVQPTTPAVQNEPGHLTDDPNGYIFPNSNTENLDEAFLRTLTDQELQYARNEIVARYGRKFKTPEIAAYFGAKTWYVPTYEAEDFDKKMDSLLNPIELANVSLINKIEAERASKKN